jgi:hypothetical protein
MITELSTGSQRASVPLPAPRCAVNIRPATLSDVPFMDALQRLHTKQVGFFPTAQFEGNIKQGKVLVAEEMGAEDVGPSTGSGRRAAPVGYCIASDRYFKHDDVGIIYQMNVVPNRQRSFVGAMLLKAQFERSAWGCKLYCCWCAQDIAANKFWEAMGFVALAYRTGSAARGRKGGARIHIFWQKRIRSGDTTTPWWFPSETAGGALRENRLVLPIAPGTHWSDAKPLVLPFDAAQGGPGGGEVGGQKSEVSGLLGLTSDVRPLTSPRKSRERKPKKELVVVRPTAILSGGLRFTATEPSVIEEKAEKRAKKPKAKNDPRLVAAARELRDRWLEQVNGEGFALPAGKYDVSRRLEVGERTRETLLIEQAGIAA